MSAPWVVISPMDGLPTVPFSVKIGDVDSTRMLLRVERGKGGRDPNAMLSAEPLALLREWWIEGHRQGILHREGWLFPV